MAVDRSDAWVPSALRGMSGQIRLCFTGGIGANGARMCGVAEAQGQLVAFLDDDDTWAPGKIARQLDLWRTARQESRYALISCRAALHDDRGRRLRTRPARLPGPGDRVAEYLFRRSSILHGGESLRSSTFLCDRALLELEPWDRHLSRHQDWDWALRAGGRPDVAFRVCPEVLVEVGPPDAGSISASGDWRASLDWLEQSAAYLNPRERGDFLLCTVAALAARSGSRRGSLIAARRALESARPGVPAWVIWALYVIAPGLVRSTSSVRHLALGRR